MNVRSSVGLLDELSAAPSGVDSTAAAGAESAAPAGAESAAMAEVFGLLADPGRLRILLTLRAGEANVGQLAEASGLSESATSHALGLLRARQVVRVRRVGRLAIYQLADEHVRHLLDTTLDHLRHTGDRA